MNAKMKAIKLNKLQKLVEESIQPIQTRYINDVTIAHQVVNADLPSNPLLGGCAYLSYLLNEVLTQHGYKSKLQGGMATFGINKTPAGGIEFGYDSAHLLLNIHGQLDVSRALKGHFWVEIKDLDVILDLSLLTLKEHFLLDNGYRGITDNEYLLDPKKTIIAKSEVLSRDDILSGRVGYHYAKNAEITKTGESRLVKMFNDIESVELAI